MNTEEYIDYYQIREHLKMKMKYKNKPYEAVLSYITEIIDDVMYEKSSCLEQNVTDLWIMGFYASQIAEFTGLSENETRKHIQIIRVKIFDEKPS